MLNVLWGVAIVMVTAATILGFVGAVQTFFDVQKKWLLPYGFAPLHLAYLLLFLAAIVVISRLLADKRALSQAALPPEILGHHQQLLDTTTALGKIGQLTHDGGELGRWIQGGYEKLVIPGAFVLHHDERGLEVHILGQSDWQYLRQHIKKHPLWDAISKWKRAIVEDLEFRLTLFSCIEKFILDEIGLKLLPNSSSVEEGVHPYFVQQAYERVLRSLVRLPISQDTAERFEVKENGEVYLPSGFLMLRSSDVGQRENAIHLYIDLLDCFNNIDLTRRVRLAYIDAGIKTELLREMRQELSLLPYLPRKGKCDLCKNL